MDAILITADKLFTTCDSICQRTRAVLTQQLIQQDVSQEFYQVTSLLYCGGHHDQRMHRDKKMQLHSSYSSYNYTVLQAFGFMQQ